MSKSIGLKIGVEGEAAFRKSIQGINTDMRTLKSEMSLATSAFDRNDQSQEKLAAQSKVLTKQIETQKDKIKETTAMLEKSRIKYGETDTKTQSWKQTVNGATTDLNKMELQLSDVNTKLTATQSKMVAFTTSAEGMATKLNSVGTSLSNAGQKLTMGITLPLAAAGVASVKLASDYSESVNKVDVAFGNSADTVIAWSETTLDSFGIASGTALDMAATFGDMGTSMGLTQDQAAGMSTSLSGLAGDLASFKNIDISEAVTALNGVFTGETESLKKLGIIMTESALDAYALKEGYGKTTAEMTQAEKVTLRYSYILDSTKNSSGDFARTSDGTANSLRTFTESIKEAGESMGKNLLPLITPLIQKFTAYVKSIANMDSGTQKMIIKVAGLTAIVGPLLTIIGKVSLGTSALIKLTLKAIPNFKTLSLTLKGVATSFEAVAAGEALSTAATLGVVGAVAAITVAAGVGVAAFVKYKDKQRQIEEGTYELIKASEDYREESETALATVESNIASRQAAITTSVAEAQSAQDVADALYRMQDGYTATDTEATTMQAMVDSLNAKMPELSLSFDQTTGSLSLTKDEVNNTIDALVAAAEKAGQVNALTSNSADLFQARMDYDTLVQDQATVTQQLADSQQSYIDKFGNSTDAYNAWATKNKDQIEIWQNNQVAIDDAATSVNNLGTEHEQMISKITGEPIAAFQEVPKQAETSAQDTVNAWIGTNQAHAQDYINGGQLSGRSYSGGIQAGINGEIPNLEATESLGMGSVAQSGLNSFGQKIGDDTSATTNTSAWNSKVLGKVGELPQGFSMYGDSSITGFNNGINAKTGGGLSSIGTFVENLKLKFTQGLGIHSPSTVMHGYGVNSIQGLLDGLSELDIVGFTQNIVQKIKDTFAAGDFSITGAVKFLGTGLKEFIEKVGLNVGSAGIGEMSVPVSGPVTSGFGYRSAASTSGIGSTYHEGIDIGASYGSTVGAAGAGTVSLAQYYGGYGNAIKIDHGNGLQTLYAHLSKILVSVGDFVTKMQAIGLVGSTGNSTGAHLHFGMYENGQAVDPSALFGFSVGSRYVPQDMVAQIHQGEMIIPKSENPYANSGGKVIPNNKVEINQQFYASHLSETEMNRQFKNTLRKAGLMPA